jgi:hypothetical protein
LGRVDVCFSRSIKEPFFARAKHWPGQEMQAGLPYGHEAHYLRAPWAGRHAQESQ